LQALSRAPDELLVLPQAKPSMSKLAAIATEGKVYGLDYSEAIVAVAEKTNTQ
jgi:hypothetical protein